MMASQALQERCSIVGSVEANSLSISGHDSRCLQISRAVMTFSSSKEIQNSSHVSILRTSVVHLVQTETDDHLYTAEPRCYGATRATKTSSRISSEIVLAVASLAIHRSSASRMNDFESVFLEFLLILVDLFLA